jgi:gas vesicle protein
MDFPFSFTGIKNFVKSKIKPNTDLNRTKGGNIMDARKNITSDLLKGIAIGSVAGAIATLLAVPATNRKLRKGLQDQNRVLQQKAEETLAEARRKAEKLLQETESQIVRLRQQTETALNEVINQTERLAEKGKDAVANSKDWLAEHTNLIEKKSEPETFIEQVKEKGSQIVDKGKQIFQRTENGILS